MTFIVWTKKVPFNGLNAVGVCWIVDSRHLFKILLKYRFLIHFIDVFVMKIFCDIHVQTFCFAIPMPHCQMLNQDPLNLVMYWMRIKGEYFLLLIREFKDHSRQGASVDVGTLTSAYECKKFMVHVIKNSGYADNWMPDFRKCKACEWASTVHELINSRLKTVYHSWIVNSYCLSYAG